MQHGIIKTRQTIKVMSMTMQVLSSPLNMLVDMDTQNFCIRNKMSSRCRKYPNEHQNVDVKLQYLDMIIYSSFGICVTYFLHKRGNTINDLQEIHINHYADIILIAALTIWRKLLHDRRQVYMFKERMHGPLIV